MSARHSISILKFTHFRQIALSPVIALAILGAGYGQAVPQPAIAGLKWRNIGPFRGGRVSAVAGVVSQPDTFYIGLPAGGVWKTTSAGTVWNPVFDSVKGHSAISSIAVAQSNPNVVYAGTYASSGQSSGECVYRSSDAGTSWTKAGPEGAYNAPVLLVDPKNENFVIAAVASAAIGKLGAYRSIDGGKTWAKTLNIGKTTGVHDMTWAYDNPKVILATCRESGPMEGMLNAGPPAGAELYKSTDQGITWTKLKPTGLPNLVGRTTTAIAQGTHSQRMYLIGNFGFYRSDDGGQNWRKMATDDPRIINGQGGYSSGVFVDAYDPDIVYTIATCMFRSTDGGKSFSGFKGAPGGDDPQCLWVDPVNKGHLLYGGDQGATVSLDAGKTWSTWYNQNTAQVYHVAADNRFPYWVYATQQDSGSIATASAGALGQITQFDWYPHPGNEGGYLAPDPLNPSIVYGPGFYGGINRVSIPSYQSTQVEPDSKLLGPGFSSGQVMFNPANPHELLTSGTGLVSSTDGGIHWKRISPDLATVDKAKDQFASIRNFSPSPLTPNVIWVHTSTNLIQVTTDHGQTWSNVTPTVGAYRKPLAVYCVEASGTDRSGAYAMCSDPNEKDAAKQIQFYRTADLGKTWQKTPGFYCSNLRSDVKAKGLVFACGSPIRFTIDDGVNWQSLNLNLPDTAFTDLQIHGNDLILGTYGRGIWILDDYSPLRQMAGVNPTTAAYLYKPATAIRVRRNANLDTPLPPEVPHAPNPPLGVCLYYTLPGKPSGEVTLDVYDAKGERVRHFSSAAPEPFNDPKREVADYWPAFPKPIPTEIGMNRINWNCRYDSPRALTNNSDDTMQAVPGDTPIAVEGPLVAPGSFKAVLTVDGKQITQWFDVANDPRSKVSTRDLERVLDLQKRFISGAGEALDGYHQADALVSQVNEVLAKHPVKEVADAANAFIAKIQPLRGTPVNRRRAYGPPQPNSFANLNVYLILQMDVYSYGDSPLTDHMLATYGSDWTSLQTVLRAWAKVKKEDLAKFNNILKKNNLQVLPTPGDLHGPLPPPRQFLPEGPTH